MATPAHLITMGLKHALNASIREWFRQFNFLPPLPLMAAKIDFVPEPVSLENLLQRMADSTHTNFILIIHGYEDGSGLYLGLAPHQSKMHTTHYDLQRLMDLDSGGPKMSRADFRTMGIPQHHVDKLLDLRHRVQSKRIDCVEFRSCNLGRNRLSLDRFRRFFGARRAGAPDLHTVFGIVPAKVGQHFLSTHQREHTGGPWETYNFPNAFTDPNLVCCFELTPPLQKPESGGHIVADTAATLDAWIKKYLKTDGSHAHGNMAMHALWIADRQVVSKDPKEKPRFVPAAIAFEEEEFHDPLGGWGGPAVRRLIPPLSENYKKHIIYAP